MIHNDTQQCSRRRPGRTGQSGCSGSRIARYRPSRRSLSCSYLGQGKDRDRRPSRSPRPPRWGFPRLAGERAYRARNSRLAFTPERPEITLRTAGKEQVVGWESFSRSEVDRLAPVLGPRFPQCNVEFNQRRLVVNSERISDRFRDRYSSLSVHPNCGRGCHRTRRHTAGSKIHSCPNTCILRAKLPDPNKWHVCVSKSNQVTQEETQ